METRYDPTTDLTEYSERVRATCPVCGGPYHTLFSIPDVPATSIDPRALAAFERLLEERIARARARLLNAPEMCETCSRPTEDGQTKIHLFTYPASQR